MDGTIIDNMPYHKQAWLRTLAELDVHINIDELERYNRGTIFEIIRLIFGNHLSDSQVIDIADRKEALYRESFLPHLRPIDGFETFLDQAKLLGIPMALATNAGEKNIDFVMDRLGVRSYFNTIVGERDIQHGKPDPEIFLIAAQNLNTPSEGCIVFEDSHAGFEAAYRAGMKIVAITTSLLAVELSGLPGITCAITDYTVIHPATLFDMVVR